MIYWLSCIMVKIGDIKEPLMVGNIDESFGANREGDGNPGFVS